MLRACGLFVPVVLLAGFTTTTVFAQEGQEGQEGEEGQEPPDSAEPSAMDQEARLVFQAGTVAFEDGRFEEALDRFRTAYELSGRKLLLYNIGVSADRLRRDQEALAAFEQFLEESSGDAEGVRDAEGRVEILRGRSADGGDGETGDAPEASGGRAVLGPVLVGAAGLGLLVVPLVGALTAAGCTQMIGTTCVEEQQLDPGMAGLFIGLGVAALTAAVLWFLVSGPDDESESASAIFVPGRMAVRF